MVHILNIKLIRTYTTLPLILEKKPRKVWVALRPWVSFYTLLLALLAQNCRGGTKLKVKHGPEQLKCVVALAICFFCLLHWAVWAHNLPSQSGLAQFPVAAAVGPEETGACSGMSIDVH